MGLLRKDTPLLSVGSCFARNIAIILSDKGFNSYYVNMSEAENSTFATNLLLNTEDQDTLSSLTHKEPVKLETLQARMKSCECAIITIGVAQLLVNEQGKYAPYKSQSFSERKEAQSIMTSPEQNVRNIVSMVNRIREFNSSANIILTVSPIPLIRSFRTDSSAFEEDCISKSIMRLAASQVMSLSIPNLFYWPSFEIVRWLTAHAGPVFGGGEGPGSRHINVDVIDIVARLFMEKFAKE